jgi:hypothetical protein
MRQQTRKIDWDEIQTNELKVWYYVAKITGNIIEGQFPYYTYAELWKQISEDPEYKKTDDN